MQKEKSFPYMKFLNFPKSININEWKEIGEDDECDLKASRTMMTTRSTAGFVQQWWWWCWWWWRLRLLLLLLLLVVLDCGGGGEQGEREMSEHWLKAESSVRVRRNPLVKRRIATEWRKRMKKKGHIRRHFSSPPKRHPPPIAPSLSISFCLSLLRSFEAARVKQTGREWGVKVGFRCSLPSPNPAVLPLL